MHRLLRQQIRKRLDIQPEELDEIMERDDLFAEAMERVPGSSLVDFLYTLSESFEQADRYQNRTHHALQMSTQEINRQTEALRKERETFLAILECAPYGVMVVDRDVSGECTYVNPEFTTITGYSIADIPKVMDWCEKTYPDSGYRQEVMDVWVENVSGSFDHFETTSRMICRDGSEKEIKLQANPLNDQQVIVMLSDITIQRQEEKTLLERENQLRTQLDYILSTDDVDFDLLFTDLVDPDVLQKIQDVFAEVNEVASVITDLEGNPITRPSNFSGVCQIIRRTEKGRERCIASDRDMGARAQEKMEPVYDKCGSCGFMDASAPIIVAGKHVANWLIGQSNTKGVDLDHLEAYAREIGADLNEMKEAFLKMPPSMTVERFEKVLRLLWLFAGQLSSLGYKNLQLAREHATPFRKDRDLEKVR
ncbi:MAG: PocR ligand-binding domain-containing protein [Planctomycetota bacterium]